MPRARTLLVVIVAVAAALLLWQKNAPQPDSQQVTSSPSPDPAKPAASIATGTDVRGALPPPTSTDARQTPAAPAAQAATTIDATAAPAASSASLRLDVRAPPSAHVGDRVTIAIDAEAYGGVRNLAFGVRYDRHTLQFVSASPGSFVEQASASAAFSAESPSDGEVLVNMFIKNEGLVAAAGTVVVIEFNVLRAGTSTITFGDVNFLQSGQPRGSAAAVVRPASIVID